MAELSGVTGIRPGGDADILDNAACGATVSIFDALYKDATDNKFKKAGNTTLALAELAGIAFSSGVDGGSVSVVRSGTIVIVGTTVTKGLTYVLASTAGKFEPITDAVTSNEFLTYAFYAKSTTELVLMINPTQVSHP